jgi:hypothetical protein
MLTFGFLAEASSSANTSLFVNKGPLTTIDGCNGLQSSFTVEEKNTIEIPFTKFPLPTPKPSNSPNPMPAIVVAPGAKNVSGSVSYDLDDEHYDISVKPVKAGKDPAAKPGGAASPPAKKTKKSVLLVGGSADTIIATILGADVATLVKPSPSASPATKAEGSATPGPFTAQVMGVRAGTTDLVVRSGHVCSYAIVRVVPRNDSRFFSDIGHRRQ